MCHLHARKFACPYDRLRHVERQLVDAARAVARISDPILGWAVRATCDTQIRIFACGASSASDLLASEQKVVRDSAAQSFTRICDIVVVRASDNYWPSREFIFLLAQMADLNTDVLIVDHKTGKVERWTLQQIIDCDRTIESPNSINTTASNQTALEAAASIGS